MAISLTPPQQRAWDKIRADRPVYTFRKMPTVRSRPQPVTDEQTRQALMYRVVGINAAVIERLVELNAIKAEPVTKDWGHLVALDLEDTPEPECEPTPDPEPEAVPEPTPQEPALAIQEAASQPLPAPAQEPATSTAPTPQGVADQYMTLGELEERSQGSGQVALDEGVLKRLGATTQMPKTGRFLTVQGNMLGVSSVFDPPVRYIPLPDAPLVPSPPRTRAPRPQQQPPAAARQRTAAPRRKNDQRKQNGYPRVGATTWDVTRVLEIFQDSWPDDVQPSATTVPPHSYPPRDDTSHSPQTQK